MDSTVHRIASEVQYFVRSLRVVASRPLNLQLPPNHLPRHGLQPLEFGWILVRTKINGIADSAAMPTAMLSNAGPAR
jgi:hypothetical protein